MEDRFRALRRLLGDALDSVEASRIVLEGQLRKARKSLGSLEAEAVGLDGETGEVAGQLKKAEDEGRVARAEIKAAFARLDEEGAEKIRAAYYHSSQLIFRIAEMRQRKLCLEERLETLRRRIAELTSEVESIGADLESVDRIMVSLREYLLGPAGSASGPTELDVILFQAQEEDKRLVAGRIHDGPAQLLANLTMRLEFCRKLLERDGAKATEEIDEIRDDAEAILGQVRNLIFELRPMTLDDLGLWATLTQFIEARRKVAAYDVQLVIRGHQERYPPLLEGLVFRIIQEAVANIDLHAQATKATVFVRVEEDALDITVEDDGAGFPEGDVERFLSEGKLGIHHIRAWTSLARGTWRVVTAPGKGTRHHVRVPLSGFKADDPPERGGS